MATEADDDATTDERPEDGVPDDTQDGDAAADASDGADDDEDVVIVEKLGGFRRVGHRRYGTLMGGHIHMSRMSIILTLCSTDFAYMFSVYHTCSGHVGTLLLMSVAADISL